jgi:hypothetical protein
VRHPERRLQFGLGNSAAQSHLGAHHLLEVSPAQVLDVSLQQLRVARLLVDVGAHLLDFFDAEVVDQLEEGEVDDFSGQVGHDRISHAVLGQDFVISETARFSYF